MAITDRNLQPGTRLVAKYKGQHVAAVVVEEGYKLTDVGEGLGVFDLDRLYKSPSAAGSAIMGGSACNGWRFWSVDGEEPVATATATKRPAAKKPASKTIFRTPNQKGVEEGKARWFCNACMNGFTSEAGETPEACPEGHRNDDPELNAPSCVTREEVAADA